MIFPHDSRDRRSGRRVVTAASALLLLLLAASPAALAEPTSPAPNQATTSDDAAGDDDGSVIRVAQASAATSDTVTVSEDIDPSERKRWSATLILETGVGFGSFVSGSQGQPQVSQVIWPILSYEVLDNVRLSAALPMTIYALNPFDTSLPDGQLLLSDLYLNIGHSKVFYDKDIADGFSIAANLRVYFPTSLSSQWQNRVMTLRPSVSASLTVGPVRLSFTTMLAKYFATSTTPSVNCDAFGDQCIEGRPEDTRGPTPSGGFSNERRGGEVFIPGSGSNSFYVANSLSIGWEIIEGLTLGADVIIYNLFGFNSYGEDALASQYARAGRNQTDRLITVIGLTYQVIKQFSVGVNVSTDTTRPFGSNGDRFVVLDPTHASDNITSLNLTLTGTL